MHWSATGKRVTDPAIEQLDEWIEYESAKGNSTYAPSVRNSNRRGESERLSMRFAEKRYSVYSPNSLDK